MPYYSEETSIVSTFFRCQESGEKFCIYITCFILIFTLCFNHLRILSMYGYKQRFLTALDLLIRILVDPIFSIRMVYFCNKKCVQFSMCRIFIVINDGHVIYLYEYITLSRMYCGTINGWHRKGGQLRRPMYLTYCKCVLILCQL